MGWRVRSVLWELVECKLWVFGGLDEWSCTRSDISVMVVVECKLWVFGGLDEWRCTWSENMGEESEISVISVVEFNLEDIEEC